MWKLVLALLFALLVAIFAVQNATAVIVGFLHWKFAISLALVILGSTAIGAICVFLLGVVQQVGRGMETREYRHRVQQLEAELEILRGRAAEPVSGGGQYTGEEIRGAEENPKTKNTSPLLF